MDKQTESRRISWPTSEMLIELIDELKEAGYNIGVSHYIAAQDLILALVARGEQLEEPQTLKNLLGPLLCSTPTEQKKFQEHFERWTERIGLSAGRVVQTDARAEKLDLKLQEIGKQQRRWWKVIGASLVALLLFFGLVLLWPSNDNTAPAPNTTPNTAPAPAPNTTPTPNGNNGTPPDETQECPQFSQDSPIESLLAYLRNWKAVLGIILLVPLPLLWGQRLWWIWQARQFLVRRESARSPELERISLAGVEEELFPHVSLLRIAQGLRRRFQISSSDLDISATIRETIRRAGWFTPVYGYRQVLPEYLVLLERNCADDHQAKFIEQMLNQLVENGVPLDGYYFKDDPRLCFALDGSTTPLQLQEVLAKHAQDRLVIFSDGAGLLSSFTGELEPWTTIFSSLGERAVLTPEASPNWGYPEQELAKQFLVLPASIEGLVEFIRSLELGRSTYTPARTAKVMLPEVVRERPRQWLEREPPEPLLVEELLDSLQEYLGRAGYYWLSACAVFPKLHWDLTIYLGESLQTEEGQKLLEAYRLMDMARLPWFRYGYMPDWLRLRLLSALPKQQEENIRQVLRELLASAVEGAVSRFQLEIARKHQNVLSKLTYPLLRRLARRASPDSPLRDYIFQDFMVGLKPNPLAVRIPSGREIPIPSLQLTRRRFIHLVGLASAGMGAGLLLHRYLRTEEFTIVTVDATGKIVRQRQGRNEFRQVDLGNDVTLEMVAISGGKFLMGTEEEEIERLVKKYRTDFFRNEKPQHEVRIQPFFMGKYPVTQAQWQAVADLPKVERDIEPAPSRFKGAKLPVESVSWYEAMEFCARLSRATNQEYRLPSEAEWEYACRAGTTTPFHFGDTITSCLANYRGTKIYANEPQGIYRQETTPVGSFPPNAFGLYDMHGNVWEWCADHWHENYEGAPTDGSVWLSKNENQSRLLRGGSWYDNPNLCRSAIRISVSPDNRVSLDGFRVACGVA